MLGLVFRLAVNLTADELAALDRHVAFARQCAGK
jgi:hypothetical protein